jgi:hypothetical protein
LDHYGTFSGKNFSFLFGQKQFLIQTLNSPLKNQNHRFTVPFKKLIPKWILRKEEGHGMNSSGSI